MSTADFQSALNPAASESAHILHLFWTFFWVTLVIFALVAIFLFIAILRNFPSLSTRVSSLCVIDGACYPQRFPFFIDLLRWPIVANLSDSADPPQEMAEFLARTVLGYLFFDATGSPMSARRSTRATSPAGSTGARSPRLPARSIWRCCRATFRCSRPSRFQP